MLAQDFFVIQNTNRPDDKIRNQVSAKIKDIQGIVTNVLIGNTRL